MKDRFFWADLIRVVAIFSMVVLHVCVPYVTDWSGQSQLSWWSVNLIDSLSRVCVPFLVMLSGALLLGKKDSLVVFYRKRGFRLLKPWLFWSLIFGVINLWQGNEADSITRLVVGTTWSGFWILPVLLGLYLLAPFLSYLMKLEGLGKYFLPSYLLGMGAILMSGIYLPLRFEYSFYFILGYVLSRLNLSKLKLTLVGLGTILSWMLVAGLTYQLSNANNFFVETYYKYNSWTVILLSSFGFLFLKFFAETYVESFGQKFVSIITSLSKASFGIYFIHLLVFKSSLKLVYFPGFIFIPIISLVLYLVSFFVAKNLGSISGAEERT